jgi:hypothetical protein
VTEAERHVYLSEKLQPAYPAYMFLNDLRGSDYTVYALFNENMVYYANGRFRGDNYGPARYSRVMRSLDSGQALYNELRAMDADYFLVTTHRVAVRLPEDEFFHTNFAHVFSGTNVSVYELRSPPANRDLDTAIP